MRTPRRASRSARRHSLALRGAGALAVAVALSLWLVRGVADSPSELQLFLGRLHPLVVHLPIGFILLTVLLEGLARIRGFVRVRHAVPLALLASALSAIVAVAAGYLLAEGGGYSGELVAWHERLGIALAVGTTAAAGLRYAGSVWRARWLRAAYAGTFSVSVAILLATGHLGGTLTRGPGYLTEYMPAPALALARLLPSSAEVAGPEFSRPDEAVIYEHLVAPVLRDRCVTCHGPEKQKGDLRLDSPESITAGGTSGPVLVPGRAAESRMIQRVWLPPGHEEIMPPRGRAPLSAAEAELLRWWIDQGASFEQVVGRSAPPPAVLAILEEVAGPPEERVAPVLRMEVAAADSAALAAAADAGWVLRALAEGSAFLRARCRAGAECRGGELEALLPLAEQLAELDLSGAAIGDGELELVGRLPHLTSLSLDRTGVGDAGLPHLNTLTHLEYLNLYGTAVSDAGLPALEPLTALRSLYLWQTAVTEEAALRLEERLPRVRVSLGMSPEAPDSLVAMAPR